MWQEYFKLPFENFYSKVLDSNSHMVFDFMSSFMSFDNKLVITDENKQQLVDCLNDKLKINIDYKFSYNPETGLISLNDQPIILLRGWGFLTGTGGCNLNVEKAFEIQQSLGNWIINKLNNK